MDDQTNVTVEVDPELIAMAIGRTAVMGQPLAEQVDLLLHVGIEFLLSSPSLEFGPDRTGRPYDDLSAAEQLLVRATWNAGLAPFPNGIDLTEALRQSGMAFVIEADSEGRKVRHPVPPSSDAPNKNE